MDSKYVNSNISNARSSVLFVTLTAISQVMNPQKAAADSQITFTSQENLLEEIVTQRANASGINILLTRKAVLKQKEIGAKQLFEKSSVETIIDAWTIVHLPEEDIAELRIRYEKNLKSWDSSAVTPYGRKGVFLKVFAWEIDIRAHDNVIAFSCGQPIHFQNIETTSVVLYQSHSVPTIDFCRSRMLVLAAYDIEVIVQNNDNSLTAKKPVER